MKKMRATWIQFHMLVQLVASIMYAMVCSRPDIAHVVSLVSRFMAKPGIAYWEALKWTYYT